MVAPGGLDHMGSCLGRCGERKLVFAEVRAALFGPVLAPAIVTCQCDTACAMVGDCCADIGTVRDRFLRFSLRLLAFVLSAWC